MACLPYFNIKKKESFSEIAAVWLHYALSSGGRVPFLFSVPFSFDFSGKFYLASALSVCYYDIAD